MSFMEKLRTKNMSDGKKTILELENRINVLEKEVELLKTVVSHNDEASKKASKEMKIIFYEWLNGKPYQEDKDDEGK